MIKAVINTKTIVRNIKTLRTKLSTGVKVCAVVKANAYGLGDVQIAQAVEPHVEWLAVAKMREALKLRRNGTIKKPILLFGTCNDVETAIKNEITITAGSLKEVREICTASTEYGQVNIHIKVNTGMNRYGITSPMMLKSILAYTAKFPNVAIDGLYTHMSHEIDKVDMINSQLKKFAPFRAMIKRSHPKAIIHAACSGSSEYPPAQFDMVRVGKAMYGGFNGYKTAISITSKVCAVQHIQKGCGVNYGHKFVADKNTTIGIVSCGYADCGYLSFGHTTHVYIGKTPCKILGVVCMDSFAIDVSDIPDPLNKSVNILGYKPPNCIIDFVKKSGISACLLLCAFNFSRTEVVYH